MINFAFKNGELKEKTQDTIFSLPIKNSNRLLKNRFRIRIPKLGGFRIGIANPNLNTKKLFIFHIIIIWNYLLQKDMFISYWIHHNISPFFYCITVYCSLIFKLLIFRHKWTKFSLVALCLVLHYQCMMFIVMWMCFPLIIHTHCLNNLFSTEKKHKYLKIRQLILQFCVATSPIYFLGIKSVYIIVWHTRIKNEFILFSYLWTVYKYIFINGVNNLIVILIIFFTV